MQVDLVVGEAVEAARDDAARAACPACWPSTDGQRDQLLGVRAPRRHRVAVAVVVGRRLSSSRTPIAPARAARPATSAGHRLDLVVGRRARRQPLAHHVPAHGASGRRGSRRSPPCRPSSRSSQSPKSRPVPRQPGLERRQRHALDPRHQPHQVVGACAAPAGASVKPQLPPNTVVTPCSGDGLAVGSQSSWAS